MIQCIICEDWFHGRHLLKDQEKLPKDENYSEMICYSCYEANESILKPYAGLSVTRVTSKEDSNKNVQVVGGEATEK